MRWCADSDVNYDDDVDIDDYNDDGDRNDNKWDSSLYIP